MLTAIRGEAIRQGPTGATGRLDLQRVERYTYTSSWGFGTQSKIRTQGGIPRVVMLDITEEPKTDTVVAQRLTPTTATR